MEAQPAPVSAEPSAKKLHSRLNLEELAADVGCSTVPTAHTPCWLPPRLQSGSQALNPNPVRTTGLGSLVYRCWGTFPVPRSPLNLLNTIPAVVAVVHPISNSAHLDLHKLFFSCLRGREPCRHDDQAPSCAASGQSISFFPVLVTVRSRS